MASRAKARCVWQAAKLSGSSSSTSQYSGASFASAGPSTSKCIWTVSGSSTKVAKSPASSRSISLDGYVMHNRTPANQLHPACCSKSSVSRHPRQRRTFLSISQLPASFPPTQSSLSHLRTFHTASRCLDQPKSATDGRSSISSSPNSRAIQSDSKESVASRAKEDSEDEQHKVPKSTSDISMSEVRRLLSLAKPEKKTLGIALGLLTVSSAVSLSVPFTLGRIIDLFTNPESATTLPFSLPVAAALLATVFALGAAANTGRSILMRISGQRIVQRLRLNAYENTLKLDMAKFDLMGTNMTPLESDQDKNKSQVSDGAKAVANELESGKEVAKTGDKGQDAASEPKKSRLASALSLSAVPETTPDTGVRGVGDIISRLGSDSSIVGESLTRELSEGLRALATVVVGVGMMIYISAKLTAVMLCIVPPTAIGAVFYGRYLKKLSRRTQKKVGELIAVAEERLSSIRTVQAFNAVNPYETSRFNKKANDILDLAKKEAYASGLFYGGAGFSGNITMLALLSYGGKLVSQGEITVGDLSSLMLYTAYVGGSLVGLTSFFSTIMKGLGAAARCFELLDAKPASVNLGEGIKLPTSTPPRPLTFSNVTFKYPSRPDTPILDGVDFTLQRGRSVAIAGGSGSGKSTIVNLLVRYYDPSSGSIKFGDEDIRSFTPESWRDRVSIVPQDPALFSQTIAENIAYGKPDATMSEIREAARLANCTFIEDLPQGFDTPVGAKAAQISGGQRQRLAIARALVRKPSILILDEATSALDAASEALVNDAIRKISNTQSITTILVAHRLSTLKTADEIIFMENGKISERGPYEELAREGSRFWQLVRSQLLGTGPGLTPSSSSPAGEEGAFDDKEVEKEARQQ